MTCRNEMIERGDAAIPRSCPECQFGPCKKGKPWILPGVNDQPKTEEMVMHKPEIAKTLYERQGVAPAPSERVDEKHLVLSRLPAGGFVVSDPHVMFPGTARSDIFAGDLSSALEFLENEIML